MSHQSIRLWCIKFGAIYARKLTRRHGGYGDTFYIDEVFAGVSSPPSLPLLGLALPSMWLRDWRKEKGGGEYRIGTIRLWCIKFGALYSKRLKRKHGGYGDTFLIDEVFVKINGKQHYLWRAVDQDGEVIDVYLQAKRDGAAAKLFFKRLLRSYGGEPRKIVTDKLRSFGVAHRHLSLIHVSRCHGFPCGNWLHCFDRYQLVARCCHDCGGSSFATPRLESKYHLR